MILATTGARCTRRSEKAWRNKALSANERAEGSEDDDEEEEDEDEDEEDEEEEEEEEEGRDINIKGAKIVFENT